MTTFAVFLLPALALAAALSPQKYCGGIYHTPCDAGEVCVDIDTDSCVPGHGGFDCPAQCIPKAEWEKNPVPTVIAW